MSRADAIRELLKKSPDDTFLLYSLGMELLAAGRDEEAAGLFHRVLRLDEGYLGAYAQAAQALSRMGNTAGAVRMLRRGLEAAERAGDAHARDRLRLMLEGLGPTDAASGAGPGSNA